MMPLPTRRVLDRALLVAAALALAGPVACRPRPREVGAAFQYDVTEHTRTDPALLLFRELAPIPLPPFHARAIALDPGGLLLVGGSARIIRIDPDSGRTLADWVFAGEVRALAVRSAQLFYAASRDSVTPIGPEGAPLAQWETLGERASITSLAFGDDLLWVADAGQRQLLAYDPSGRLLAQIGASIGEGEFIVPSPHFDVAAARARTVWVVNPGRLRVEHRDLQGRILENWGAASMRPEGFTGCCNPTDIARLADGSFVTAEKGIPRLKLHGADGAFAGLIAGSESFDPETTGLDVAVDRAGRILALDPTRNQIRRFVRR